MNPVYETTPGWDILCNIETGKITINKDIQSPAANASLFPQPPSFPRTGSNGNVGAAATAGDEEKVNGGPLSTKPEFVGRADNYDAMFVEELQGLSELQLRARATEYVQRFVQLATRYEEDSFGASALGYPSLSFSEVQGSMGSGAVVEDPKEMAMSTGRIDGWRRSVSYEMCKAVGHPFPLFVSFR